jgi:hypothetical protein
MWKMAKYEFAHVLKKSPFMCLLKDCESANTVNTDWHCWGCWIFALCQLWSIHRSSSVWHLFCLYLRILYITASFITYCLRFWPRYSFSEFAHVLKKSPFMCLLKDCESAKSWPCVAQCILYCYVIYAPHWCDICFVCI